MLKLEIDKLACVILRAIDAEDQNSEYESIQQSPLEPDSLFQDPLPDYDSFVAAEIRKQKNQNGNQKNSQCCSRKTEFCKISIEGEPIFGTDIQNIYQDIPLNI